MDLQATIEGIQHGDVEGYGEIVRCFEEQLRGFIAAYCPQSDLVDDVAQRVFVWAFEHIREYRTGTHFYLWLKAIARNILLSELEARRREVRNRHKYLDYLQATSHRQDLQEDGENGSQDLIVALRFCFERLGSRAQWMIRQRYETHDPLRTMAATLGTTTNTVKVKLYRIRQQLRRCIEEARTKSSE